MKTKTASVRLPKEMYEEIDSICDEADCSRNDWIKDKLKEALREESNENNQDQEENTPRLDRNPAPKPEPKEESKPTIELIPEIKEPKVIIEEVPQDNSNKPVVQFTQFNGKLLPFAKRYNL